MQYLLKRATEASLLINVIYIIGIGLLDFGQGGLSGKIVLFMAPVSEAIVGNMPLLPQLIAQLTAKGLTTEKISAVINIYAVCFVITAITWVVVCLDKHKRALRQWFELKQKPNGKNLLLFFAVLMVGFVFHDVASMDLNGLQRVSDQTFNANFHNLIFIAFDMYALTSGFLLIWAALSGRRY